MRFNIKHFKKALLVLIISTSFVQCKEGDSRSKDVVVGNVPDVPIVINGELSYLINGELNTVEPMAFTTILNYTNNADKDLIIQFIEVEVTAQNENGNISTHEFSFSPIADPDDPRTFFISMLEPGANSGAGLYMGGLPETNAPNFQAELRVIGWFVEDKDVDPYDAIERFEAYHYFSTQ